MLGELLAHPGVVEDVRFGSAVGVMALHGGIEEETSEVAIEVAAATGASLYAVIQPDDLAWHIPSIEYHGRHSAGLERFLGHIDRVISLHGFGRPHLKRSILVGGADRTMAGSVGAILRRHTDVRVIDALGEIPKGLRGCHPDNPVNRTRGGGVQLELSASVRWEPDRTALVHALTAVVAQLDPAGESSP